MYSNAYMRQQTMPSLFQIESLTTRSMENVSTGVLDRNKEQIMDIPYQPLFNAGLSLSEPIGTNKDIIVFSEEIKYTSPGK